MSRDYGQLQLVQNATGGLNVLVSYSPLISFAVSKNSAARWLRATRPFIYFLFLVF